MDPATLPPSRRMLDAARVIARLTESNGFAPSLHEIADVLGVNHARVRDLVHKGRARGLVAFEDGKPRTLRVVDHRALRKERGGK